MTTVLPLSTQINQPPLLQWQSASWSDYERCRDSDSENDRLRLFFMDDQLLVQDMSSEGIEHSGFCDLLTMILFIWLSRPPQQPFTSLGRCLIEKVGFQAAAPDLVVYLGETYPKWQTGQPRRINLDQVGLPNLVGEIADTTLASDLDEKKRLYAAIGIPEYWVIDVQARRVFMFQLQDSGTYQEIGRSIALAGLAKDQLTEALVRTQTASNGEVAMWFAAQISTTN